MVRALQPRVTQSQLGKVLLRSSSNGVRSSRRSDCRSWNCIRRPKRLRQLRQDLAQRPLNSLEDRKSTRLNSSQLVNSYAVFCLKKNKLLLHLHVKPLITLTTVLYLSCALMSGHLAMMLMELNKRRYASFMVVFNRPINILCRVSLFLSMVLCLLLRLFVFRLLRLKSLSTLTLKVFCFFLILPATLVFFPLSRRVPFLC